VGDALRYLHVERPDQLEQSVLRRKQPGHVQSWSRYSLITGFRCRFCDTPVQGQFPGNIDNKYNQFSVFSPVKAQYAFILFSSR
jgi:hypothetical protein